MSNTSDVFRIQYLEVKISAGILDLGGVMFDELFEILDELMNIERPDYDIDGYPINDACVLKHLSLRENKLIDAALQMLISFAYSNRNKLVSALNNHGFQASFGSDQYESSKINFSITLGNDYSFDDVWKIKFDISDRDF